jgi:acyl dehydratase
VGREKLREFAAATGATVPACFDPAAAGALGYADVVAAPTFAVVIAQRAEAAYAADPAAGIDFSRVVHAEESIVLHRPIIAGDWLTPTLRVVGVRQRGAIAMVTTEVKLADPAGVPVASVTSVLAVRDAAPPADAVPPAALSAPPADAALPIPPADAAPPAALSAPPADAASLGAGPPERVPGVVGELNAGAGGLTSGAEWRAGDQLGPVEVSLTRADLVRYAGASGDFNPIHWSDAAARAAGLSGVIAHGMATMGYAIQFLVTRVGDPGAIAEYSARFVRPVPVPEGGAAQLHISGGIVAVVGAAATVNLTVESQGVRVLARTQAKIRLSG